MATTPATQNAAPLPATQGTPSPIPTDSSKKGLKNNVGERVPVRAPPKPQGTHPHALPTFYSPNEESTAGQGDAAPTPSVGNKRGRGDTTGSQSSNGDDDATSPGTNNNPIPPQPTVPPPPVPSADIQGGETTPQQQTPLPLDAQTPTAPPLLMKQTNEQKSGGISILDEMRARSERNALQKAAETNPQFVNKPKAGFPTIHRLYPTSTVDNLCPETLETWMHEGGHGLLASVQLLNVWMPGRSEVIVKLIKSAVKADIGIKSLFVAPAVPAVTPNPTEETAPPPPTFSRSYIST